MTVSRAGDRREEERREQDRQLQRMERAVLQLAIGWRMNPDEHTDELWDATGLYLHGLGIALPDEPDQQAAEGTYVDEGWWHPNVKSGQVHDHPRPGNEGRGWSSTSHRLCESVYTRRTIPAKEA